MSLTLLALAGIVFVAYGAQTITGFGSVVIALTLSAQLMPIPEVLALIIPLSLAQCGYIAARDHGAIDWRLLGSRILPLMGLGTGIGILVAPHLTGHWLRVGFAIMVLLLSARELFHLLGRASAPRSQLPPVLFVALLTGAGVIHGIYASGGPMLVYAVNRAGLSKAAFRSTLLVVWLVLNSILLVSYVRAGAYDSATAIDIAILVPALVLGMVVGEHLHHRVDERRFRIGIFVLLCGAALLLLAR